MPEENEIEIRSEEVQEILTAIPHWLVRSGNLMILLSLMGILSASWFIKYPDTIPTQIVITTKTPPEKIFAVANGRMAQLLVIDNQLLKQNEALAVVENTAVYSDVILLKEAIADARISKNDIYFPFDRLPILVLGEITANFSLFENNYLKHTINRDLKPELNESIAIEFSIRESQERLKILTYQGELNAEELILLEKDLDRQKVLYENDVISIQDYEKRKLEVLQAKGNNQNIKTSISQLKESISNGRKDLNATVIRKKQNETKFFKETVQSYYTLQQAIEDWEQRYVLKTSINGRVTFLDFWNANQTVKTGDHVFTIIPSEHDQFIGRLRASIQNSGKIKGGQDVNISLANYPQTEFGMLKGRVRSLSLIADRQGDYMVKVDLPKSLITTYGKEIEFRQEMRGTAEIITEDLRLIERFFYQLRGLFSYN